MFDTDTHGILIHSHHEDGGNNTICACKKKLPLWLVIKCLVYSRKLCQFLLQVVPWTQIGFQMRRMVQVRQRLFEIYCKLWRSSDDLNIHACMNLFPTVFWTISRVTSIEKLLKQIGATLKARLSNPLLETSRIVNVTTGIRFINTRWSMLLVCDGVDESEKLNLEVISHRVN